jgi:ribosomal protein L12E/L44/L45/RPP1/RPP2
MDVREAAHLIPAARAACAALRAAGQPLSRDRLAAAMRDAGNAVSNARACLLLRILKAEENVAALNPGTVAVAGNPPKETPEVAA